MTPEEKQAMIQEGDDLLCRVWSMGSNVIEQLGPVHLHEERGRVYVLVPSNRIAYLGRSMSVTMNRVTAIIRDGKIVWTESDGVGEENARCQ